MRRRTNQVEVDAAFGFWREVRQAGQGGGPGRLAQQRTERQRPDALCAAREESAARFLFAHAARDRVEGVLAGREGGAGAAVDLMRESAVVAFVVRA